MLFDTSKALGVEIIYYVSEKVSDLVAFQAQVVYVGFLIFYHYNYNTYVVTLAIHTKFGYMSLEIMVPKVSSAWVSISFTIHLCCIF